MSEARPRLMFLPAPERLIGERVVVRAFTDADAEAVFAAIEESRRHLRPWLSWQEAHRELDDTREFVRRAQASLLVREDFHLGMFALDGRFLGGCGLHTRNWSLPAFEIGYWIRASAQGQGYVSEAVRLLTGFAFEALHAQRVAIRCRVGNARSAAVAQRVGYHLEGTMRNVEQDADGNLTDVFHFSMLPEEYERASSLWRGAEGGR